MKVTVHLPNGLPSDQLAGVVEDLRRHFPDAGAFVGLSTDEELLERVHAAYPAADILVRFYHPNRMSEGGEQRAFADQEWLRRHPWVHHVTPANELNLDLEHAGTGGPFGGHWNSEPAYQLVNLWLVDWARTMRAPSSTYQGILHWPALSPQPDELEHLHLCAESLRAYDVIDLHMYGRLDWFRRELYSEVITGRSGNMFRGWVTETNAGQGAAQLEFMRQLRGTLGYPVEVLAWFIYDSADAAFDWCKIRGRPEELLWSQIAREAKEWPTTPTPQPPPGGNMLKDLYPDVYAGWLAEQGGAEAVLENAFEDHGVGIGLRPPTISDFSRLADRATSVAAQLQNVARRFPKA